MMKFYALYHDLDNLDNVDVVDEEFVVDLATHYTGKKELPITRENVEKSLYSLLKLKVIVRAEELLDDDSQVDKDISDFYSKDASEFD